MKKSLLWLSLFIPSLGFTKEKPVVRMAPSPIEKKQIVQNNVDPQPQQTLEQPKQCKASYEVFFTGDFLYWSAFEEGLTFASTGINTNSQAASRVSSVKRGAAKNFHAEWSPGFRIGVGTSFRQTAWDLYANWTHFSQHNTRRVHKSPQELNNPLNPNFSTQPLWSEWILFQIDFGVPLNFSKASWRLHYDTLDLELGRTFTPETYLEVRPFIGIRAVRIHQKYSIEQEENHPGIHPPNPHDFVRNRNNFKGIGLRAGANTLWLFCRNFGLYGNLAFSLISGKFEVLNYQRTTLLSQNPFLGHPVPYLNSNDHFGSIKPCVEIEAGFHWETKICKDKAGISFHAGWQEIWWPQQNQMRRYLNSGLGDAIPYPQSIREKGDLGIHGLVAGARIGF
jgi:hypothetical protein